MSIRATEGGPPWDSTSPPAPEPKRRSGKLVVLAILVVIALGVGGLAAAGKLHVPFLGAKTKTVGDPAFGWTITIPTKWMSKAQAMDSANSTVRFQAEGSGVGIRVQAQRFKEEIPADQVRSDAVVNQLKTLVSKHGPDVTIREGPTFGTIRGVPDVRYVYTFTDSSGSVPVTLQDVDCYLFNGAKLEEVTFETTAARYASALPEINKAIQTFRSQHFTVDQSPSVTATATSSPGH